MSGSILNTVGRYFNILHTRKTHLQNHARHQSLVSWRFSLAASAWWRSGLGWAGRCPWSCCLTRSWTQNLVHTQGKPQFYHLWFYFVITGRRHFFGNHTEWTVPVSTWAVVLLRLATGASRIEQALPSTSCSAAGGCWTPKDRRYVLMDGQERAALGHSDFRKAALKWKGRHWWRIQTKTYRN